MHKAEDIGRVFDDMGTTRVHISSIGFVENFVDAYRKTRQPDALVMVILPSTPKDDVRSWIDFANSEISAQLNGAGKTGTVMRGTTRFAVGDRVMAVRNDHARGLYAGSVGKVVRVVKPNHAIRVRFERSEEVFEDQELDKLKLAFCLSIERFQGGPWKRALVVGGAAPAPADSPLMIHFKKSDTKTGVSRATLEELTARMGLNEADVVHRALRGLADQVLSVNRRT